MSIKIFLDNYNNNCYPGQTLSGKVECYFSKPKRIRAVRLRFKGTAKTEWTESESYYDSTDKKTKTRNVTHSAEELYFNAEYNLVAGGDDFTLPAGKHAYPFSYILPQQLPSSYEGTYGNVRYNVKATIDRPWKFDYETRIQLNLISPLDLNYVPGVKEPAALSVDKNLCGCWCRSDPLTFDISLPVTGYISGQDVNIGAYVKNMSNVSAKSVKFKITKNIEFITHHPSTKRKYESYTVVKSVEGGIGAHGDKSWTAILTIPTGDFPNLLPCNIINMSYQLKAEVELPCPHTNLSANIPLTIGTIPLSGVTISFPGAPPSVTVPQIQFNSYPSSQIDVFPPALNATAPPDEMVNPSAPYPSTFPHPYPVDGPLNQTDSYPPPYSFVGKTSDFANAPPSYDQARLPQEKK